MKDALSDARYEIKFICPPEARLGMDIWRHGASGGFSKAYPDRVVNNIYFDSLSLRDFADNVIGLSARTKTRLRWYGETTMPESLVLEHKIKRGRLNRKENIAIPSMDLATISWAALADILAKNAPSESSLVASQFKNPVLRNRYHRQYFESLTGNLRMTIDSALTFFDAPQSQHVVGGVPRPTHFNVIEFKADMQAADALHSCLSDIPLRVSRSSKYVMGTSMLRG